MEEVKNINVIEAAKEMNEKYGFLNAKTLRTEYGVSQHDLHKVGGAKNLSRNLGFQYRDAHRPDPNLVKEDFLNVYNALGYIDTESYLENGTYSKQAIKTAFGSINNLMRELKIPLNMTRNDSPELVLADIKTVCEKYESTSSTLYRKFGVYSQSVIERNFSSWTNALRLLGLKPMNEKIGKHRMAREINKLYKRHGFLSKTLVDDCCEFSYQAASVSFGGKEGLSSLVGDSNAFANTSSTGSTILLEILTKIFPDEEIKKEETFEWLLNPRTKHHMYVDYVIPSLRICIEYDGIQHFKYIEYYHQTEENFLASLQRDADKNRLLKEHGYDIIRFRYDEPLDEESVKNKILTK